MPKGDSSTGPGTGMQFQFPTIDAGVDGNGTDVLTEDEFLKAIMAAAQSTPKNVSIVSLVLFSFRFPSDGEFRGGYVWLVSERRTCTRGVRNVLHRG